MENISPMENQTSVLDENYGLPIFKVLGVDPCARAILDHVPVRELVRSERVCRRWQEVVHDYLRICRRNDILDDIYYFYKESISKGYHTSCAINQDTKIYFAHQSLLAACKALEKFEYAQSKATDDHFKNIETECPFLRHLQALSYTKHGPINKIQDYKELKITEIVKKKPKRLGDKERRREMTVRNSVMSIAERHLGGAKRHSILSIRDRPGGNPIRKHLLQNRDRLQEEPIICSSELTGDILSPTLKKNYLRSIIFNLRNVTTLEFDDRDMKYLDYAHLLLNEMPELENLSLCNFTWSSCNGPYVVSNEQLIESISRLANLKRLIMRNNEIVNDALLEALARSCRRLEYLDISSESALGRKRMYSAGGVAVLCRRLLSATTTLCLGYIQDFTSAGLTTYLQTIPTVQKLQTLGCVELTPQWLAETCRASRPRSRPLELRAADFGHPLELRVGGTGFKESFRTGEDYNDIKIVLNTDVHIQRQDNGKITFVDKPYK